MYVVLCVAGQCCLSFYGGVAPFGALYHIQSSPRPHGRARSFPRLRRLGLVVPNGRDLEKSAHDAVFRPVFKPVTGKWTMGQASSGIHISLRQRHIASGFSICNPLLLWIIRTQQPSHFLFHVVFHSTDRRFARHRSANKKLVGRHHTVNLRAAVADRHLSTLLTNGR